MTTPAEIYEECAARPEGPCKDCQFQFPNGVK